MSTDLVGDNSPCDQRFLRMSKSSYVKEGQDASLPDTDALSLLHWLLTTELGKLWCVQVTWRERTPVLGILLSEKWLIPEKWEKGLREKAEWLKNIIFTIIWVSTCFSVYLTGWPSGKCCCGGLQGLTEFSPTRELGYNLAWGWQQLYLSHTFAMTSRLGDQSSLLVSRSGSGSEDDTRDRHNTSPVPKSHQHHVSDICRVVIGKHAKLIIVIIILHDFY